MFAFSVRFRDPAEQALHVIEGEAVSCSSGGLPGPVLFWTGRVDELRGTRSSNRPISTDAQAREILDLFTRHGTESFSRIVGPFACAIVDPKAGQVVLARDALGQRFLGYCQQGDRLIVSCSERSILEQSGTALKPNVLRFAGIYAPGWQKGGETAFESVSEVPPGCSLEFKQGRFERRRFWKAADLPLIRYVNPKDYADHYRELIDRAVACRLGDQDPTAILLSGGLDSTSIAASASLSSGGTGTGNVFGISWRFSSTPGADEGPYIEDFCRLHALRRHDVPADNLWPFSDSAPWVVHDTIPEQDMYRLKLDAAYREASRNGAKVLLSGFFGDDLYLADRTWLIRMFKDREYRTILERSGELVRSPRGRRHLARALISVFHRLGEENNGIPFDSWERLTPYARDILKRGTGAEAMTEGARHPRQARYVLDPFNALVCEAERWHASRFGVEIRYPFRDLRIVEFMMSIPSSELWSIRETRPLLRKAMEARLPASILHRNDKADFQRLFERGIYEKERSKVDALIRSSDAVHPLFVDRQAVKPAPSAGNWNHLLFWRIVSTEHWLRNSAYGHTLIEQFKSMRKYQEQIL